MWGDILGYFESQSGLANLIQISGGLGTISAIVWKAYQWNRVRLVSNRIATVAEWVEARSYQPATAKSLRIAVVDDHPEDYPVGSLRQIGYSISDIKRLSLADVPTLSQFDCILLDINGVLDEDPKRGGLEILKRLRAGGGPYIVAVSSRGFDITMSEFFMAADHRIKKPIPPTEVEGIIEGAFTSRFSATHAAKRIDDATGFSAAPSRTKRRLLRSILSYLDSGIGLEEVRKQAPLLVPAGERLESMIRDVQIVRSSLIRKQ